MKINKETLKTWVILALVFAILGFVGGWDAHDHLKIQVQTVTSK